MLLQAITLPMSIHYMLGRLAANPKTHLGHIPPELSAAIAEHVACTATDVHSMLSACLRGDFTIPRRVLHNMEARPFIDIVERLYGANYYENRAGGPGDDSFLYWLGQLGDELDKVPNYDMDLGVFPANIYIPSVPAMLELYGPKFTYGVIESNHDITPDNIQTMQRVYGWSDDTTQSMMRQYCVRRGLAYTRV